MKFEFPSGGYLHSAGVSRGAGLVAVAVAVLNSGEGPGNKAASLKKEPVSTVQRKRRLEG